MATVIRDADIDQDPLLLSVALARGRAEIASDQPYAEPALGESAEMRSNDANVDVDVDPAGEPVVDEATTPDPAALIEQIEAERIEILEQAYREGYRVGEDAGRNEAQHAYDEQIGTLREVTASMRSAFEVFLNDAEDLLVEIAFASVCKILGRAFCEREGVSAVVREVIEQVREREQLIVRLAPDDFALLTEENAALGAETWNAQLKPDERVTLGGCLIDSPSGTLDGRLETQLQRLREVLVAARAVNADGAV